MMEDSLTKEGRTLGRTRTITHLLQIIINVRLVGTLIVVFFKKKYIPTDVHTTQEVG